MITPNRHTRRTTAATTAWAPLYLARAVPMTEEQIDRAVAKIRLEMPDIDGEQAREMFRAKANDEMWMNDKYVVTVRRPVDVPVGAFPVVHLSIRRKDRAPARDWRDLQRIKNQLVGPECEAVELYPAESRTVDLANQFHLWVVADPSYRFPFGFERRVVSDNLQSGNSKQRAGAGTDHR